MRSRDVNPFRCSSDYEQNIVEKQRWKTAAWGKWRDICKTEKWGSTQTEDQKYLLQRRESHANVESRLLWNIRFSGKIHWFHIMLNDERWRRTFIPVWDNSLLDAWWGWSHGEWSSAGKDDTCDDGWEVKPNMMGGENHGTGIILYMSASPGNLKKRYSF